MRHNSLLSAAVVSLLVSAAAAGQEYRISGSLVSAPDGTIVHAGHVSATVDRGDRRGGRRYSQAISVDADERGRFLLNLPEAGRWMLTGSGKGFRPMLLDQHESFSTAAVVSAARPGLELVFRLTPDASIQGYVVDEAGEPVRTLAQVRLLKEVEDSAHTGIPYWGTRGSTRTDDLGGFEFAGLAPGRYEVVVQAQPWYAAGAPRLSATAGAGGAPDSPLDMAYPLTFYPGVIDPASAGVITLQGGEVREADLRLLPVPSTHLRVAASNGSATGLGVLVPQIRLMLPGDGLSGQTLRPDFRSGSALDLGGLAPGSYEVSLPGGERRTSILQIGPGSPRTLDLSAAVATTTVTVLFAMPEGTAAPAVRFTDREIGRSTGVGGGGFGGIRRANSNGDELRMQQGEAEGVRQGGGLRPGRNRSPGSTIVELLPGVYEVHVSGMQGQYLTGLSATGAETSGRFVTIHGGDPQVTLHVETTHATLDGSVQQQGKMDAGAMVLLVPATLDDPASQAVLREEQTATDGSFLLRDIIPGRYILVAIDHGWEVNWRDLPTLRRFLPHGVPVELDGLSLQHETLEAQLP